MAGIARAAAPYYDPTAEGIKRGQAAAEMVGQLGKTISGLGTSMRREKLARGLLKERGIEVPKFGSAWDQLEDMLAQEQFRQKLGSEALEQELKRAQIQDYLSRPEERAAKSAAQQAEEAENLRRYEEGRGFQTRAEARAIAETQRQAAAEQAKQYPFAGFAETVNRATGGKFTQWWNAGQSGQLEIVDASGKPIEKPLKGEEASAFMRIKGTEERMPYTQFEGMRTQAETLLKKYPGFDPLAQPPPPPAAPEAGAPPSAAQGNVVPFQSREQVQSLPSGTRIQMPDGRVVTRR